MWEKCQTVLLHTVVILVLRIAIYIHGPMHDYHVQDSSVIVYRMSYTMIEMSTVVYILYVSRHHGRQSFPVIAQHLSVYP